MRRVLRQIFRVPLHREIEARRRLDAKRLDQAVVRDGLDDQSVAESRHALPVQGVDHDAGGARQTVQHTALDEIDLVGRSILHVERIVGILLGRRGQLKESCEIFEEVLPIFEEEGDKLAHG